MLCLEGIGGFLVDHTGQRLSCLPMCRLGHLGLVLQVDDVVIHNVVLVDSAAETV